MFLIVFFCVAWLVPCIHLIVQAIESFVYLLKLARPHFLDLVEFEFMLVSLFFEFEFMLLLLIFDFEFMLLSFLMLVERHCSLCCINEHCEVWRQFPPSDLNPGIEPAAPNSARYWPMWRNSAIAIAFALASAQACLQVLYSSNWHWKFQHCGIACSAQQVSIEPVSSKHDLSQNGYGRLEYTAQHVYICRNIWGTLVHQHTKKSAQSCSICVAIGCFRVLRASVLGSLADQVDPLATSLPGVPTSPL